MSFETSENRIVEPERDPGKLCAHQGQSLSPDSELTPLATSGTALDLDALARLRAFFELLGSWDQKETDREK
jgi:hypothetical protein